MERRPAGDKPPPYAARRSSKLAGIIAPVTRSIRARLLATFLVPAAIFFAATAAIAYLVGRRSLEDEVGRGLVAIAQGAAATLPQDRLLLLAPGDEGSRTYPHLLNRLDALRQATGVKRIYAFDRERRAIVDSGGALPIGARMPHLERDRGELERLFSSGVAISSSVAFEDQGELYSSGYAPVKDASGAVVAAVGADASARHHAAMRRFALLMAAISALGLAVVGSAAFAVAATVTRPLRKLVDSARTIGAGDLDTPIGSASNDEVGDLSKTLDEMRRALKERNEELQRMLAGVAHEVRNPLGGIDLFSGLLAEGLGQRPDLLAHVDRIRRELVHLERFVEDFLAYARERPPEIQPCDAGELLREVADLVRPDAAARNQHLAIDAPRTAVLADGASLRRAVLNLLRNAVQAAPEGGHVWLSCGARDGHVEIRVRDDGPGVPPARRDDLFKRFFTTKEKGLGLGLAFVRKIAEAHGGQARLEPTEAGASFLIRLPEPRASASGTRPAR